MVNAAAHHGNAQQYQWFPESTRRLDRTSSGCRHASGTAGAIRIHALLARWFQRALSSDQEGRDHARTLVSHQKGMKNVRYRPLRLGSPEPALAAVDRRNCSRPPRTISPRATRSTRRSTTRPAISPRRRSTTAPATSTTCWTASATACRCCRPPTPASPRCRAWSPTPSRLPTRCCRPRPATRPSPA